MNQNQDLIDVLDADGARFTVKMNEPEAIAEAVAGWLLSKGNAEARVAATNINVLDNGDIVCGSLNLTDAQLVEFVQFALANHA